jgi:hypothetical protein
MSLNGSVASVAGGSSEIGNHSGVPSTFTSSLVLRAGLRTAAWVSVDDTGARHAGNNGFCTQVGNDSFTWFGTRASKSRLNFLDLLRAGHTDYVINDTALGYMRGRALAGPVIHQLAGIRTPHSALGDSHISFRPHFELPPAGRTKDWIMLTFGCRDAWVRGHGGVARRPPSWMTAWGASRQGPGRHVGATCSWHPRSE